MCHYSDLPDTVIQRSRIGKIGHLENRALGRETELCTHFIPHAPNSDSSRDRLSKLSERGCPNFTQKLTHGYMYGVQNPVQDPMNNNI